MLGHFENQKRKMSNLKHIQFNTL